MLGMQAWPGHADRPGFESSATWERAETTPSRGRVPGRSSRGWFGVTGEQMKTHERVNCNWLATACAVEMQLEQPCRMPSHLPRGLALPEEAEQAKGGVCVI